jgi:multiple antibiotic resistance protein
MEQGMGLLQMAGKLFPLMFNMMGPIGLIPAFAALTANMDEPTRRAVARRAALMGLIALFVAVFLGAVMLDAWSISKGSLMLAGGIIVLLTALLPIASIGAGHGGSTGASSQSPTQLAVSPLAFPTMVTPKAIAVLIIFVAFFPTIEGKLVVASVAALMMFLNLVAMRYAHSFMEKVGMTPLLVLGAVFGVLQVALGVEMMADGLQAWSSP